MGAPAARRRAASCTSHGCLAGSRTCHPSSQKRPAGRVSTADAAQGVRFLSVRPHWLRGKQHILDLTERSKSITEEITHAFLATTMNFSTASLHPHGISPSALPPPRSESVIFTIVGVAVSADQKQPVSEGFHPDLKHGPRKCPLLTPRSNSALVSP